MNKIHMKQNAQQKNQITQKDAKPKCREFIFIVVNKGDSTLYSKSHRKENIYLSILHGPICIP
jgi:hypothetical protein